MGWSWAGASAFCSIACQSGTHNLCCLLSSTQVCILGYHFTWHCLSHPITVQPQWISEYLSKEQPLTLVCSKKCSGTGSCFLKESSQVGQALPLFPMRKDMQLTLSCCQN